MAKRIFMFLIIITVTLTGCQAEALPPPEPVVIDFSAIQIDQSNADYTLLLNAPFFADGGVGVGSVIPEEIEALARIYHLSNARDYCLMLEKYVNNEGKLYALCALYYLDYPYYKQLMEEYRQSEESVTFMGGCTMMDFVVKDLVLSDEENAPVVRLKDNTETLEQWRKKNNTDSFIVDFYGGGIPELMKEYLVERCLTLSI